MIRILIVILTALSFSFCQGQSNNAPDEFRKFLGQQQRDAFDKLVKSYETFLSKNMSGRTEGERAYNFLNYIVTHQSIDTGWLFETSKNEKIIRRMEKCALRKEIWLYPDETYEPEFDISEIVHFKRIPSDTITEDFDAIMKKLEEEDFKVVLPDSVSREALEERIKRDGIKREQALALMPYFNSKGKFLYGLAKFYGTDSLVSNYAVVTAEFGALSPVLISNNFLRSCTKVELEEQPIKYIIVADLYMELALADIRDKK